MKDEDKKKLIREMSFSELTQLKEELTEKLNDLVWQFNEVDKELGITIVINRVNLSSSIEGEKRKNCWDKDKKVRIGDFVYFKGPIERRVVCFDTDSIFVFNNNEEINYYYFKEVETFYETLRTSDLVEKCPVKLSEIEKFILIKLNINDNS